MAVGAPLFLVATKCSNFKVLQYPLSMATDVALLGLAAWVDIQFWSLLFLVVFAS